MEFLTKLHTDQKIKYAPTKVHIARWAFISKESPMPHFSIHQSIAFRYLAPLIAITAGMLNVASAQNIAESSLTKSSINATAKPKENANDNWSPEPWIDNQRQLRPGFSGIDVKKLYAFLGSKASVMRRREFETSTEYEHRIADISSALAPLKADSLYAFRIKDFELYRRFRYDADKQEYYTGQFSYLCLNSEEVGVSQARYKICDAAPVDEGSDEYVGSNTYGASRLVERRREHQFGLAIEASDQFFSRFFKSHFGFQDRFHVPLEKAKSISGKTLGVLFVGHFLEPQLVSGHTTIISPTINSPQDIRVRRTGVPFKPKLVVYYVVETGEVLEQREP